MTLLHRSTGRFGILARWLMRWGTSTPRAAISPSITWIRRCPAHTASSPIATATFGSPQTLPAIAASREDPKILGVDDAEIVGDGRREFVEPERHGFAQETEHGFGEVAEFGVAPVVGDVLVHHLPKPFDRVEMRAVGRHEMQDDAPPRLLHPILDDFGVVVAGVVEEDVDAAHRRIGALQRFKQSDRARRVDGLNIHDAGLSGLQVDGAVQVQPVAPGRRGKRAALSARQPASSGLAWW